MHHCLLIPEILQNIIDDSCLHTKDLLLVALACRAFYDPAMDVLWQDLEGLGPLIMCLPDQFWQVSEDVSCPKAVTMSPLFEPSEGDWDRVRHHARRLRSLTVPDSYYTRKLHHIKEPCWKRLENAFPNSGPRIFPGLKSLYWRDDDRLRPEYFSLLMQPSVTSLRIDYLNEDSSSEGVISVLNVLGGVQSNSSNIQFFTLSDHCEDEADHLPPRPYTLEFMSSLNSMLSSLDSLTALDVNAPIDGHTLSHLATLPSLKSLHFAMEQIRYWDGSSQDIAKFRSLSTLTLETSAADSGPLLSFMKGVDPTHLLEIIIHFDEFYGERATRDMENAGVTVQLTSRDLKLLFAIISNFDTLRSLKIDAWHETCNPTSNSPEFVVDYDVFAPLFRLREIRTCHLGETLLDLSSPFIERLAVSWSHIQELDLGSSHPHPETCIVPAEDLLPFSMHCPKLVVLKIRITPPQKNPPGSPPMPPLTAAGLSRSNLRELHTCASYLEESSIESTAKFLAQTFPRVVVRKVRVEMTLGGHTQGIYLMVDQFEEYWPRIQKLNSLISEAVKCWG